MSEQARLTLVLPSGGKEFTVPVTPGATLLDALLHIQEEIDPSVGIQWNCRTAQCGICAVILNGTAVLACTEKLRAAQEYRVEPIHVERHLQGLVCDVSEIFEEYFLACSDDGAELSKKSAFEQLLLNATSPTSLGSTAGTNRLGAASTTAPRRSG